MTPKPLTENFAYNFRVAVHNILNSLISVCLSLLFIWVLYFDKLSVFYIYGLIVVIALISFIKLVRKILLFLAIQYIESLTIGRKLHVGLKVCNFYLKYNPILYFLNSQAELGVKVRRILNSKFGQNKRADLIYACLLFVFYYPLMRLLYCYFVIMRTILSDNSGSSVSKRMEFYLIISFCLLPVILDSFFGYHFVFIFLFLLLFLFPILNSLKYLFSLISSPFLGLLNSLRPHRPHSYINKLLAFIIANTVNFTSPAHCFSLSYPTVYAITLMRNDISLFSKLFGLYCNIVGPTVYTSSEDFIYAKLFFYCGTLDKRSCIGSYYYNSDFFFVFYHINSFENNSYISYLWYKALYNVLSENWYDAGLIEFFLDLHNTYRSEPDFNPIDVSLLKQLNQSIENHLHIIENVFKLIWDIEKDGGIDPISVLPGLQEQLPDDLDYPINQYCFLLFGGFNRLDGLFIIPDVYKQNIGKVLPREKLNEGLENKVIEFFISNHTNLEARMNPKGHGGVFQENGLHLITGATMPNLTNIYNTLVVRTISDPENIMNLKHNASMMAYDSLFFDDEIQIRQFIIKRLGESLAKGREEGKNNNSNIK